MMKGTNTSFTATKWHTVEDKTLFMKKFIAFLEGGMKEASFSNILYERLSCSMFGHIAHFDRHGFMDTWFSSEQSKLNFLKNMVNHVAYGDPSYTWSDVEKSIQKWLSESDLIALYERKVACRTEVEEMRELDRLEKKYGKRASRERE